MTGPPPRPPEIPGFRYVEVLGRGGFADVFAYEQLGLGRRVAVKVMLEGITRDSQRLFESEASVMARLSNHPSIVSIYQAGAAADGRPFLVMEHCPPPPLAARLRQQPLSVGKALEVGIQIAGAVESAHRIGVLHRDIKPANILFTEFGRPALTDFGISVTTHHGVGQGVNGLSVAWAPPEQIEGDGPTDASADVYSLAATIWATLVGHGPFIRRGERNDDGTVGQRVRTDGPGHGRGQHLGAEPIDGVRRRPILGRGGGLSHHHGDRGVGCGGHRLGRDDAGVGHQGRDHVVDRRRERWCRGRRPVAPVAPGPKPSEIRS